MTESTVLDSAGRRRSPATMPGYHAGRPPRNKGRRYPADPPTVEEIVAVMRQVCEAPVRAPPAPSRACARAGPRGQHRLAAAGPRQPRHDQHLPAGHRHRGDHRGRSYEASADDAGQRGAALVTSHGHGGGVRKRIV